MKQIQLGTITKPQGLKGEFRVRLSTDFSLLQGLKTVVVENLPYSVVAVNNRGGFVVMKLKNVTDINQVEPWRNTKIFANSSDIVLQPDEHLASQLVGYVVVTQEDKILGKVKEISNFGAGDVFTVQPKNGNEFLFTNVNGVVKNVLRDKNEIVVDEEILKQGMVVEDGH